MPGDRDEEKIRRLATVVRDSNDAITLIDFNGNIHAWNHGAERMYGYSEAEALKMNIMDLVPSDLREKTRDRLNKLQQGEKIESFETKRITKDGRVLDIWLTVTVLKDNQGRPNMIATTERNITERKRLIADQRKMLEDLQSKTDALQTSREELEVVNEELRSTNDALTEANLHLSNIGSEMTGYSHLIINTLYGPLKKINDEIASLKGKVSEDQAIRHVEALTQDSKELTTMVNDLSILFYSSRAEIHTSRINLSDMVRAIADKLKAGEPGSKVRFIIPRGIAAYVDKGLIEVAIRFMLANSWEHVHDYEYGTIAFYIQNYENEGVIIIFDNRAELNPAEFASISNPISEDDRAEKIDLGLMVAKKIIDRHHGRLWIDYEIKKGLNFCMTLPLHTGLFY